MPPSKITFLSDELKCLVHPTLNPTLDVNTIPAMGKQKIWWVCEEHGHPYQAIPRHKTDGQGCSVCSGKQVHAGFNDLATVRPEIASQWHPTLNGQLLPTMVTKGFSKKVWWMCNKGHEFESLISNRKTSSHCPVCSGRIIVPGFNDVATLMPQLAGKFHSTKNGEITLTEVGKGYPHKLWWVADCGHEVEALISNCLNKIPCPYCIGHKILVGFNDVATTNPDVVNFWHPIKNLPKTPQSITKGSDKKFWWICPEGHEDYSLIINFLAKEGRCSYCEGHKLLGGVNDFATVYPDASQEWHPNKNAGIMPSEITASTNQKYWWICGKCDHEWEASPANRGKRGTGCPVCSGKVITPGFNDLATVLPEVASQWHPTLNGDLKPNQITVGASREIWWKCKAGHEWKMRMVDMTKSFALGHVGCMACYRSKLPTGTKSLAEMHPSISAEWDYQKNDTTPDLVAQYSSKVVWWKCSTNPKHSWQAAISSRTTRGSGCSLCWKEGKGSDAELEIANFIASLGVTVERHVTTLLENGKELDIYLPDYNLAIEYNGLHWHSEKYRERKYHVNKHQECLSMGISLTQIWEDDWLERSDIVRRHLAYKLNKIDSLKKLCPDMENSWFIKHYARKLSPVILESDTARSFLEEAHIQGGARSSHYFGLATDKGSIVAVLTLTKTDTADEFLLSRYATKGIVVGGFTKLLKHAVSVVNPKRIITFSDHAISNGELYANSGFSNDGFVREDYMYVKKKRRFHKFGFRLEKFKSDPNLIYLEGLSEKELATLNGYVRIWDAGKTRWVFDV